MVCCERASEVKYKTCSFLCLTGPAVPDSYLSFSVPEQETDQIKLKKKVMQVRKSTAQLESGPPDAICTEQSSVE